MIQPGQAHCEHQWTSRQKTAFREDLDKETAIVTLPDSFQVI